MHVIISTTNYLAIYFRLNFAQYFLLKAVSNKFSTTDKTCSMAYSMNDAEKTRPEGKQFNNKTISTGIYAVAIFLFQTLSVPRYTVSTLSMDMKLVENGHVHFDNA